jgi:hypothetical protein
MATNNDLHDYEMFYQEIPASDHLTGFDTEIEDHVEDNLECQGLDAREVSRLTEDTYDHTVPSPKVKVTSGPEQLNLQDAN